jgi:hypothetical protein
MFADPDGCSIRLAEGGAARGDNPPSPLTFVRRIEEFRSYAAVERLREGVVCGCSRTREVELNSIPERIDRVLDLLIDSPRNGVTPE